MREQLLMMKLTVLVSESVKLLCTLEMVYFSQHAIVYVVVKQ